jgi:hypothetical protein
MRRSRRARGREMLSCMLLRDGCRVGRMATQSAMGEPCKTASSDTEPPERLPLLLREMSRRGCCSYLLLSTSSAS